LKGGGEHAIPKAGGSTMALDLQGQRNTMFQAAKTTLVELAGLVLRLGLLLAPEN
jgi:hypothetical protein